MPLELPQPSHMPCPECGAAVARDTKEPHVCDQERWLGYNVFLLRPELDLFETELGRYLETPQGRFAVWYAARRRAA